jgi:hypothetical protein
MTWQMTLTTERTTDMARFTTITDLYRAYEEAFGSEKPLWTRDELLQWKTALGKRYEEITQDDLDEAYAASFEDKGLERPS